MQLTMGPRDGCGVGPRLAVDGDIARLLVIYTGGTIGMTKPTKNSSEYERRSKHTHVFSTQHFGSFHMLFSGARFPLHM